MVFTSCMTLHDVQVKTSHQVQSWEPQYLAPLLGSAPQLPREKWKTFIIYRYGDAEFICIWRNKKQKFFCEFWWNLFQIWVKIWFILVFWVYSLSLFLSVLHFYYLLLFHHIFCHFYYLSLFYHVFCHNLITSRCSVIQFVSFLLLPVILSCILSVLLLAILSFILSILYYFRYFYLVYCNSYSFPLFYHVYCHNFITSRYSTIYLIYHLISCLIIPQPLKSVFPRWARITALREQNNVIHKGPLLPSVHICRPLRRRRRRGHSSLTRVHLITARQSNPHSRSIIISRTKGKSRLNQQSSEWVTW